MVIDWIAAFCLLIGAYFLGKKKAYAWLLSALGSVLYFYMGYKAGFEGMMVLNGTFTVMALWNYIKWDK